MRASSGQGHTERSRAVEQGGRGSRGLRVLRGGFIALSAVLIAALSHVAGGGASPGGLGAGLALVFAVLVCIALAGRRLTSARAAGAVALSQFVFHVLFSLGAHIPTASGRTVSMLGMVMSGGTEATLPALSSPHAAAMLEAEGARMWAGHAVAAVLTILLLLHGERAFFTLVRLAGSRLALLVSGVGTATRAGAAERHRVAAAVADRSGLRPLDVLLASRPHRGPPRVV